MGKFYDLLDILKSGKSVTVETPEVSQFLGFCINQGLSVQATSYNGFSLIERVC